MTTNATAGRRLLQPPKRLLAAAAAVLLAASVLAPWPSEAAVPKLDQIRVALFLNLPGKYTGNTSAATFSSPSGLNIGMRSPAGPSVWFAVGAAKQVRFALDDYKVKWLETQDFNAALTLYKRIQALSGTGWITSMTKSGKTVYQVLEGLYPTAAEAKAGMDRIGKDATVAGLAGKGTAKLTGPLHLEGLSYASEAEARMAAQAYAAAGLDAFVAVRDGGGTAAYTVAVGAEADKASLDAVMAAASQAGLGDTLTPMDASVPYLLLRDDHTLSGTASSPVPLYALPAASAKVWLSPGEDGSGGIKVTERSGRSYRGSFEVSALNNRLAVVNELPFEQYLYSVVGGEMPSSWPAEALKAQAVAARSYALHRGLGFQIAHVVDGTLSQVYNGLIAEKPNTIAAVDATKGEVAMYGGRVIDGVFSSSAGGVTAASSEVWGGSGAPYTHSVPSPDQLSEAGLHHWYRVALADGRTGYIREDIVSATGEKTAAGSLILTAAADGSTIRPIPLIQSNVEPVAKVNKGTRLVMLEKVVQSNEMSWVRGPFTAAALTETLKKAAGFTGALRTLEIADKGPSGRVLSVLANGSKVKVNVPDSLRSALGGLPSTRFAIDETGRFSIAGAGSTRNKPEDGGAVYVAGATGEARQTGAGLFILNGSGRLRAATSEPGFRFTGSGNGHGVGLSQWGARGLAEQGYDYRQILTYYYKDVTIEKA